MGLNSVFCCRLSAVESGWKKDREALQSTAGRAQDLVRATWACREVAWRGGAAWGTTLEQKVRGGGGEQTETQTGGF